MMNRAAAMAAVAALFLVGVLVGGLAVHLYHGTSRPGPLPGPGPAAGENGRGPWQFVSTRMVERLDDELGLSPEQREAIERVVVEARRELEQLRRELRPRVETSVRETRRRIRELLTPEQAEIFDSMEPMPPPGGPRHRRGRGLSP